MVKVDTSQGNLVAVSELQSATTGYAQKMTSKRMKEKVYYGLWRSAFAKAVKETSKKNETQVSYKHRESYISARVLLNLLNELGKRDKMRGLPSILSVFRNEFNKFNKTRARMLDDKYFEILSLASKRYDFVIMYATL